MSLSTRVIDKLFDTLGAYYGASWDRSLGATPIADAKTAWGNLLQGYASKERMHDIAWALDNLPDRPPNAIEFRNLCRRSPVGDLVALSAPKIDPAKVAAELAKLIPVRNATASAGYDPKAWARRIIEAHEAGVPTRPISLRFAREAIGLA